MGNEHLESGHPGQPVDPGTQLGPYEIKEPLGKGGMGEVYRVHDTKLDRDVAIKLVRADRLERAANKGDQGGSEALLQTLLQEARTAASLNHRHVCTVHDVGDLDGQPYISMEYVEGKTLQDSIPSGGLPSETVIRLGAQIAAALSHAHSKGVVHRDLKPANVKITPEGDAKVLDFGLALRLGEPDLKTFRSSKITLAEMNDKEAGIAGTLPYMAPEVLRGEGADEKSDLWALGVVLYEAATGDLPFEGRTGFELTSAILKDACPALPEGIPLGLAAVIRRCLSKDPVRRFRNAGEVQTALEMMESGVQTARQAVAEGTPAEGSRSVRRGSPLLEDRRLTLMAAMVLVLIGTLAFALNLRSVRDVITGSGVALSVPEIRSLAVLPLDNLSGDPAQEYFADGMTESLITELGKIKALRVISRQSVIRFKDTRMPLPEIARVLDVDAVVEGSATREEDTARITVKLFEALADRQLWSETYTRSLGRMLELQREVARDITKEIAVTITSEEQARFQAGRQIDPEAHIAYMRGRYFWNLRNEEGLRRAIRLFNEAVAIEPGFALAHVGLADAYLMLGDWGYVPVEEALVQVDRSASRALSLDPSLGEAYASLGWGHHILAWEWKRAARELRRARELSPNYATAHQWYAEHLNAMGRGPEAIAVVREAQKLDPLSLIINVVAGWVLFCDGRSEEAIVEFEKTLELEPDYAPAHIYLGHALIEAERLDEAMRVLERAREEFPSNTFIVGALGLAYARAGRLEGAEAIRRLMVEATKSGDASPYHVAMISTALGEPDRAFAALEDAYRLRKAALASLKVVPWFESLRPDPRFEALLRRMRLADEAGG